MNKNRSFSINLNDLDYGSIYIKPTLEKDNYCIKCFSYLYYFLSCGCIR